MSAKRMSQPKLDQLAADYLTRGLVPVPGEQWTHSGKVVEYGPWREEQHLVFRAWTLCMGDCNRSEMVWLAPSQHPAAYGRLVAVFYTLRALKELIGDAISKPAFDDATRRGLGMEESKKEQAVADVLVTTVHRWALAGTPAEQAVAKWLQPRVEHIVRTGERP
jgi:hypothetical protein